MNDPKLIDEEQLAKYHDELMKDNIVGCVVFDISAYNASGSPLTPAKYADLTAALGTNGANVPEPMRKGGMSVKFIQSSDNKYVQCRCMANAFTTDIAQWQGVDDEPTAGSNNLVKSGGVKGSMLSVSCIYIALPSSPLPINQFYDLSIENADVNKLYWLQLLWEVDNSRQQLTLFRTTSSVPHDAESWIQLKNPDEIHHGVQTYVVNDGDEVVKMTINWDLISNDGILKSYYPDIYTWNPRVFQGGLYFPMSITDKSLSRRDIPADAEKTGEALSSIDNKFSKLDIVFSVENSLVWYATASGHQGGDFAGSEEYKRTGFIDIMNLDVTKLRFTVHQPGPNNTVAGIAYYNENGEYISGITNYGYDQINVIERSSFPAGTRYIVICTEYSDFLAPYIFAELYSELSIPDVQNNIENIEKPNDVYYAACGDSITHGNHGNIEVIPNTDPYCPIDGQYSDYKRKDYAYYIAKQYKMKWANYGIGGSTLTHCEPKAYGAGYFNCFVDARITSFKQGIDWDYISILFGWNDLAFGPLFQRDLWLQETYGEDIGYPVEASQIGTAGFASQAQKDACDAATGTVGGVEYTNTEEYFIARFIGTINDNTKNTWYGAWNYALDYLMKKYPKSKILIVAPYVWNYSEKIKTAVHNIAEKYGVLCFDFDNLPYWYYSSVPNNTPLENPNFFQGMWLTERGDQCPATVEGYNQARFSYDTVHPSNLGYKILANPFGSKMING